MSSTTIVKSFSILSRRADCSSSGSTLEVRRIRPQISASVSPERLAYTTESILPSVSERKLSSSAGSDREVLASQQMFRFLSINSIAVGHNRNFSSSSSILMSVRVVARRRACSRARRKRGCAAHWVVTILNCWLSVRSRLPGYSLQKAFTTLCRVVTPSGSTFRMGQCLRASSTYVRCVEPLRSISTVDTMKRTQGGSSVGSQCRPPSGAPSFFSLCMPSMMITMRAGECFLAAASRKRFRLQRNSTSVSGTFISLS
mmetsp:Transcript_26939/g.60389  ORF Transcript_26939/g.60389 Transcript_26939/m.60389 type:complete len:258 (-) Transcript_26939:476-1249(-)